MNNKKKKVESLIKSVSDKDISIIEALTRSELKSVRSTVAKQMGSSKAISLVIIKQ